MAAAFDPSTPETELDAVNSMLAAIGEQKLPAGTDITTTGRADIDIAVDTLAKATRETLSAGWKFNSLYGFEVAPTATYAWADRGGATTTLNVFKKPSEAISWSLTKCPENGDLDMIERMSLKYQETGASVLVLFDRTRNRDGAEETRYPGIYLDYTFAMNFEQMPESARRFVAVRAARQFAAQTVGAPELVGFTQTDEMQALRILKREQGITERLNFMDTLEGYNWSGGRNLTGDGRYRYVYRGGA